MKFIFIFIIIFLPKFSFAQPAVSPGIAPSPDLKSRSSSGQTQAKTYENKTKDQKSSVQSGKKKFERTSTQKKDIIPTNKIVIKDEQNDTNNNNRSEEEIEAEKRAILQQYMKPEDFAKQQEQEQINKNRAKAESKSDPRMNPLVKPQFSHKKK